jgi:hypothetical protein
VTGATRSRASARPGRRSGARRVAGEAEERKTVTADDDYLSESIETPNKEIVASFSALMEAVIKPHAVSEQDARDLIAFIKTVR